MGFVFFLGGKFYFLYNRLDKIKKTRYNYQAIGKKIMSRCHQKAGRSKHSHTCIEMTYILSGTAMHAIQTNDGELKWETLTVGNYYILDYNASHVIYQTSDDFFKSMNGEQNCSPFMLFNFKLKCFI